MLASLARLHIAPIHRVTRARRILGSLPASTSPLHTHFDDTSFEAATATARHDADWHTFAFEDVTLAGKATHEHWERACEALVQLRYFPASVMHVVRAEECEGKAVRVGESFAQMVALVPGVPASVLSSVAVDVVAKVCETSGCPASGLRVFAFSMVTSDAHDEIGQHSVWLRWDGSGKRLSMDVLSSSTFKSWVPGVLRWHGRWLQRRAHRLGIEHMVDRTNS